MVHRRIGAMMGILLTMLMLASCAPPPTGYPFPDSPETPVPEMTPAPDINHARAVEPDAARIRQRSVRSRFMIRSGSASACSSRVRKSQTKTGGIKLRQLRQTGPYDFFVYDLRSGRINLMLCPTRIIRDIPAAMWPQYPALYRVMGY